MSDTAVLNAPVTAAPAPPPSETPETEGKGAPEQTGAQEATPETDVNEFAGLSPAQIKELLDERVAAAEKSAEARTRESVRRSAEADALKKEEARATTAYQESLGKARALAAGAAVADMQAIVHEAATAVAALEEGQSVNIRDIFNARKAQEIVNKMSAGLLASYAEQIETSAGKAISEHFPDLKDWPTKAAAANGQFMRARDRGDVPAMMDALVRAALELGAVQHTRQSAKDSEALTKAEEATESLREATDRARNGTRPTAVAGGAGRTDWAAVIRDGGSIAEMKAAYKQLHGIDL